MFGDPEVNPHERFDAEERWETVHRHHRIQGVALLFIALVLAGGGCSPTKPCGVTKWR